MTKDQEGPGTGSALRHEVEAPKIADQFYQAFPNLPTVYGNDPKDGMPRATSLNTLHDSEVPDLDPTRFVCGGDTSTFVVRNEWGEVLSRYPADAVERTPNGRYRAKDEKLGVIEVQPIRPQCAHYARQLIPWPEDQARKFTARLCTARRTDEGEFLSVNDTQVYACELRSPPYGNESSLIDAADLVSMQMKRARALPDDFDLDAALQKDAGEPPAGDQKDPS